METIGAAATILQVADVALRTTCALIEYTRNTQGASSDRKALAEKVQSLSGLLERLRARAEISLPDDKWLGQRTDLVHQFARAYDIKDQRQYKAARIVFLKHMRDLQLLDLKTHCTLFDPWQF